MSQRRGKARPMMKKAVILAAGDSTRMLPLSANQPKHLLPIAGKPLIFHTLEALQNAGITEVLIIYGYHKEKLSEAIESRDWGNLTVSYVHQEERKGTAHAAGHAREFVGDDSSILMNGDIMLGPGSFEGLISYHQKGGYGLTLSVRPVDDPSEYGVVAVEDGKAVKLIEKPTKDQEISNLVNAGLYVVNKSLMDAISETKLSPRREYEITDSIGMLIEKGNVGGYMLPSWWLDIGKPWDLLVANEKILSQTPGKIEGTVEECAVIKGETTVQKGAIIKSGAYIEGPAIIGENSVIGPNCYIRAHTAIGNNVRIGNAVEIKNSIIMDGTNIGHLSYVGDSVIGRSSNFGAGTITANLRHDNGDISVTVKDKRVSSGRRKLGAIIGDNVKTGIGTSISPGIVIHQGARTGIGVIVFRDIKPFEMVIARQEQKIIELDRV
ncbi:glucose-1-phosphate thymidylyltransferase [Candidatus Thorarchaeota archaeon]|nr:MAG: glucose-1-phosphate thymidylyltransferase [Candidatus Thorarchaeota archaeon]